MTNLSLTMRTAAGTSRPSRNPQTTFKATRMNKILSTLVLSAFAAVAFNANAGSHAGAPMKAASAPAAKASAPAKHKAESHKKAAKPAAAAASK